MKKHRLYKTRDADAPESIKDRNGDVVLDLCRDCGAGESELQEDCEKHRLKSLDEKQLINEMSVVITGSIMDLIEAVVKQRVRQWIEFIVESKGKKDYGLTKETNMEWIKFTDKEPPLMVPLVAAARGGLENKWVYQSGFAFTQNGEVEFDGWTTALYRAYGEPTHYCVMSSPDI